MNRGVEGTGEIRERVPQRCTCNGNSCGILEWTICGNHWLTLINRDEKGMGQNHLTLNRTGVPRERTSVFCLWPWAGSDLKVDKTGASIVLTSSFSLISSFQVLPASCAERCMEPVWHPPTKAPNMREMKAVLGQRFIRAEASSPTKDWIVWNGAAAHAHSYDARATLEKRWKTGLLCTSGRCFRCTKGHNSVSVCTPILLQANW